MTTGTASPAAAAPRHSFFYRLYTGTGAFDVVGRRRKLYIVTAALLAVAVLSIALRQFSLGIDFEGGTRVEMPAAGATVEEVQDVFTETLGFDPVTVQVVGSGETASIQIRSEALDGEQVENLQRALFTEFSPTDREGNVSMAAISTAEVSETWGGQITQKAIIALIVFLVLVTIYIAVRFEWDMAVASIASLVFDLLMTAGIYALIGFEVTPATVIGLLTILGFSLYDTVVVFDKVEENTRGVLQTYRRTYAEQANLAVNQTFMRSINTTVIGVLPILALMVIAVWMLGVGTLKDLALVQIVGVIVGAYSSVFFATPLLVTLKERNPKVVEHTKKVLSKRAARQSRAGAVAEPPSEPVSMAKAGVGAGSAVAPRRARTPQPGARPTGKRRRT